MSRILAALTGIPTLCCGCGFATRCGREYGLHVCDAITIERTAV